MGAGLFISVHSNGPHPQHAHPQTARRLLLPPHHPDHFQARPAGGSSMRTAGCAGLGFFKLADCHAHAPPPPPGCMRRHGSHGQLQSPDASQRGGSATSIASSEGLGTSSSAPSHASAPSHLASRLVVGARSWLQPVADRTARMGSPGRSDASGRSPTRLGGSPARSGGVHAASVSGGDGSVGRSSEGSQRQGGAGPASTSSAGSPVRAGGLRIGQQPSGGSSGGSSGRLQHASSIETFGVEQPSIEDAIAGR